MVTAQSLVSSTLSPNPADELSARVKDALWFLARQWQTGEFEAENGGMPAAVQISRRDHPITRLTFPARPGQRAQNLPISLAEPPDMIVEAESPAGDAAGWRAEALEYRFNLATDNHELEATEYTGRGLDWWHFDLTKVATAATPETSERMVPTMLHFKGAPHPRWWRYEDGDAAFDAPVDPEPNVLSSLLHEFFYIDLDNWYVLPLPLKSGSLREITSVKVTDSFGVVIDIGPAQKETDGTAEWRLFCLSGLEANKKGQDGSFLLAPHIAGEVLDNDTIEDVRFLRDDDANLVWAVEVQYTAADGSVVRNGDGPRIAGNVIAPAALPAGFDGRFHLQSATPAHWIPYVPRLINPAAGPVIGEIYLRRGRTVEEATVAKPQYKAKITSETIRLNEEEVASVGIRVRRIHRYARGTDGQPCHWVARCREMTDRLASGPGLRFDYITGGGN